MARPGSDIFRYPLPAAVASGLLLTGAFPGAGMPVLAGFALVPLLLVLRGASFGAGFRLGFITGLAHFISLIYWASYTMNIYGHLPLTLCVPLLVLLAAYLALYPALFAGLTTRVKRPGTLLVLIPVFWTVSEYLRANLFTGFPWELLGYSQYRSLPLIQIADLTGVYGVSFWLALVNAALFLGCASIKRLSGQSAPVSLKTAAGALLAALCVSGLLWAYGQGCINRIDQEAGRAARIKIAVLQGNIEQNQKWDRAFQRATLLKYNDLAIQAGQNKPDLIVWPETATPFFIGHNRPLTNLLVKGIQASQAGHLIGTPGAIQHQGRTAYYNSAVLFDDRARIGDSYNKVHLVPFGEYVPFKRWLPFISKMVAQVGDFIPGQEGHAVAWQGRQLGIQICYEIIFPDLSRAMVQNKADVLINITNDAWFGETAAPRQHFSMAVFRAVENHRSLARAANTGISGFIGPTGRILCESRLNTATTLTRALPVMTGITFYTAHGDLFALGCLGITLLFTGRALAARYRKRKKPRP